MFYRIVPLLFVAFVAACASSEADNQELRTHQLSCIKSGHAVDTPEYTDCVVDRYRKAQAERDRMRENMR